MRLPSFTFLLLCLLTWSAESTIISQEPGKNLTLDCSVDGCPESTKGYNGLYLYHELNKQEEVVFVDTAPNQQIAPRSGYIGRIQKDQSNFIFTISNLTKNDSGLYKCVYKKLGGSVVNCRVYAVFITEITPCSSPAPPTETIPSLMLFMIFSSIICLLIIWIFFILIVPRVKQWCSQRRSASQVSRECVYEDMRKNLSALAPALEQSPHVF